MTRHKNGMSLAEIDQEENDRRERNWHKRFGPRPDTGGGTKLSIAGLKGRKAGPVEEEVVKDEKRESSVELVLSSDGESVKEEVPDDEGVKEKSGAEKPVDDGPKPVGPVTREVKEEATAGKESKVRIKRRESSWRTSHGDGIRQRESTGRRSREGRSG